MAERARSVCRTTGRRFTYPKTGPRPREYVNDDAKKFKSYLGQLGRILGDLQRGPGFTNGARREIRRALRDLQNDAALSLNSKSAPRADKAVRWEDYQQ